MLTQEFQFYLDNQAELVGKYNRKILVIKNKKVVGVFNDELTAINDSLDKFEAGTFLVQECLPGSENYTQRFNSRVRFLIGKSQ